MLSKQLDPVLTLGHLLNKPYFSDIASEDEWRNSHSEEASFTLRKKLARAKTEAALEGISQHEDCILRAPRGSSSQSKWESRGGCPEPLRVNKSSPTTTASSDSAWERHGSLDITAASCTADTKGRTQRVQTYTPSGAVLVTDSEGQSRLQTPERSSGGERRVRFGEQGLEEHQAAASSHIYATEIERVTRQLPLPGKPDRKMGESRQELLAWLNGLLQLNVTKVEQCGTGAAFCQIYDSIFLDLPMARVKFNANSEYQYLENFKILQNTFRKHHVDRPLNTEQLVKCKMQDNLEFLQWSKRYWDQYFPGGDYEPVSRRKGAGGVSGGGMSAGTPRAAPATSAARRPAAGAGAPRAGSRQAGGVGGGAASAALQAKNAELVETVQGLERERDFYFSKLRDIELLIQQAMEADPSLEEDEGGLLKQIQTILYSTEEAFEHCM